MEKRTASRRAAWAWVGVFAILVALTTSMAGVRDGGGGDVAKSPFNSYGWFYGTIRPIRVCVDVAPGFGLNRDQVIPPLKAAFETWKSYIDQKHVNIKNGMFGGRFQFDTDVVYLDACNGSEDLAFYFGTENKDIETEKGLYTDPVAFSALKSFDREQVWGKGYVWVASEKSLFNGTYPNWHFKDNVLAILIHEIGHIYGNTHVPGTIMTEHIMDLLTQETSSLRTSIDLFRELYHCDECALEMKGYAVTNSDGRPNATHRLMTKILTHPFSGLTQVTLSRAGKDTGFKLSIEDQLSGIKDQFQIQVTGERSVDGPFVFSNAWLGWSASGGKIYYGYLTNPAGEKVNMVLEFNLVDYTQSTPEWSTLMRVSGFADGEFAELFTYQIEHWTHL